MSLFNSEELTRYSRHFLLPEVGLEGQEKLKKARVLCIGLGGLGSPVALYLAAAGVGHLGLVDDDSVALSNLHRQILHHTADCHRPKTESARTTLQALNPHVEVQLHEVRITAVNAVDIAASYDVIVDGSDNFSTRYLINDLAFFLKKPLVYGSVFRFEGQCTLFHPAKGGPCYRCLFPEPPPANAVPSCAEAGVLGVLPGIIGTLQAAEVLKFILSIGDSLQGRLLQVDALTMKFKEFQLRPDPQCPLCGEHPSITELMDLDLSCSLRGFMTSSAAPTIPSITVEELHEKLQGTAPFQLIDVREPFEYEICQIPGAQLIPLGVLPQQLSQLKKEGPIYLQCRSGARSAEALLFLQREGFSQLYNVEGGILAWAERVDPTIKKY